MAAARKSSSRGAKPKQLAEVRTGPKSTDAHEIVYYRAPDGSMPARDYLDTIPAKMKARFVAIAIAVAAAPPTKFAGGGMLEAMHHPMTGWFEIRVDGPPNRTHYRVFCLLDVDAQDAEKPYLVLVDGRTKAFRTVIPDTEYVHVKALGDHYRATQPRPIG